MCEIIDFQSRRGDFLRRKASELAELSRGHAVRIEWLKRNGASLADQVRAALDAARAGGDCRQIEQALAALQPEAPAFS